MLFGLIQTAREKYNLDRLEAALDVKIDALNKAEQEYLKRIKYQSEHSISWSKAPPESSCSCSGVDFCSPELLGDTFKETIPVHEPRLPDLKATNLSFAARIIIAVRDKFNGNAVYVYSKSRVSRQVYSNIISDETYQVTKHTAIRFAIGLECSLSEAEALLNSAGYDLSNSITEDLIIQHCLANNPPIYDFKVINKLLERYKVNYQY